MTRASRAAEPRLPYGVHDQVVYLSGVSWADYERIDALRDESSVPRLTYVEGVLELMSPGTPHESDKKRLARLFEAYLEHIGVPVEGLGSWTVKDKKKKLGAEADECYVFTTEPVGPTVKAPDLVIEVVHSPGGIDKLDIWRKLGAREVWFWQDAKLDVFVLRRGVFVSARRSALVPAMDLELVVRCMAERTQTAAIRALRAALAKLHK